MTHAPHSAHLPVPAAPAAQRRPVPRHRHHRPGRPRPLDRPHRGARTRQVDPRRRRPARRPRRRPRDRRPPADRHLRARAPDPAHQRPQLPDRPRGPRPVPDRRPAPLESRTGPSTAPPCPDLVTDPNEARALAEALGSQVKEQLQEVAPDVVTSFGQWIEMLGHPDDPGLLADRVAAALGLDTEKEVQVLLTREVGERLRLVTRLLVEARTMADLRRRSTPRSARASTSGQREVLLRQQLRAIQKELGEEPRRRPRHPARAPRQGRAPRGGPQVADRELRRLEGMQSAQAEYNVIRTYLEWIAELPWSTRAGARSTSTPSPPSSTPTTTASTRSRSGSSSTWPSSRSPATAARHDPLPRRPARGRQDLARPVDRRRHRPPLRPHRPRRRARRGRDPRPPPHLRRRPPGPLIHAMKKAGKKNPVILLDEIDKLGQGWMGSPEAALLEVLDPEQNKTFTDHYLELPFDLSEVSSSSPPTASRRCRPRCATASRSSRSPATPPRRSCTSPRSTSCPSSSAATRSPRAPDVGDDATLRHHPRLHPRGRRPPARARADQAVPRPHPRVRAQQRREAAPASPSTRRPRTSTSARSASSARSPSAPPSPASPPASPGPPSAATSCSSRPRGCPARATSRSPDSSAT
jgi:hypothetical protein